MPVASKAVPSVIASVCYTLHCLVSALTQRGWWRTLFFFFFFRLTCSVALWGGREGCCKQVTLACPCSASATLGLPPLTARVASLPTLLGLFRREQSEAGPGLHVPPRSKPLRFRHSGSPQRRRLGWACILCPSQVRAAQVMTYLVSAIAATYRLPAA